jgi:hypothetical protein
MHLVSGGLIALLGFAVMPLVFAYRFTSSGPLIKMVRGLGALTYCALVVSGGPSDRRLDRPSSDTAPSWIPDSEVMGVAGIFAWVLLASVFTLSSTTLGPWVFWFGLLAGASVLFPIVISVLVLGPNPAFIGTDATINLDILLTPLAWWCLPIWLIALTVRIRALRNDLGR